MCDFNTHRITLCEVCLMSAQPVIKLDDSNSIWEMSDWLLGVEINRKTVLMFDELIDVVFNIHVLDEYLTTLKEGLDAQNSDGQLRLRYHNGA